MKFEILVSDQDRFKFAEISGDKNIKISANSDVTVILQSGTMATTTGLTPIAIKEEIQTIPSSDSIDVSGANYIEISDANLQL